MTRDGENGAIIIDSIVNFIKTVEGKEDYMNVSYASAKCTIKNASMEQLQKTEQYVNKIITTSLKGLTFPNGDVERAEIENSLAERGMTLMLEKLQN